MAIGFGVIGCGMIANFHAKAIADIRGAKLAACFDMFPASADRFAKSTGCTPYHDLKAMLADPNVDVVTICTPSGAHLEPAVAAANAGKHVIVEKPLEITLKRCDKIIDACEKAGVVLSTIFPSRFHESSQLIKKAIDKDRFGRLTVGDAYVKWFRTQEYYDSGAWRGTWALDGGGALMNQSIHTVDLLLHIMGDVESVRAQTRLIAHEGIEVEDTATAMLTFKNGALGTVQGSTACWSAAGHPAEIQICGEHGSVFMTDDRFKVWEFAAETDADTRIRDTYGLAAEAAGAGAADPAAIDFSWHQRNFEDVTAALQAGRRPSIDGAEARRAVALIEAIYTSAKADGARVDL